MRALACASRCYGETVERVIRPLAPERALPRSCRSIASAYERWPRLRVLDARDEVSFAHGHPEGAGRLTIEEFSTRRMELPARETALLVVHDAPARALAAAEELVARGYEHASWLEAPTRTSLRTRKGKSAARRSAAAPPMPCPTIVARSTSRRASSPSSISA